MRVASDSVVEFRGVEEVPDSERTGRVQSLGPFWFSANAGPITASLGLIPAAFGLNLTWAIVSILVGTAAGAAMMAGHAVQGPRLGVPQMIQSRAQFGMFGAVIPCVITLIIYLGYGILGGILGGDALATVLHISTDLGIILANLIALVVAVFGYHFIHRCARVAFVLFVISGLAVTINLIGKVPSGAFSGGAAPFGVILASVAIFATNQLTWSPYVSDYTRYLPRDVSAKRAYTYTFFGSFLGSTWPQLIGALAATVALKAASADLPAYVGSLFSGVSGLVIIGFVLTTLLITNTVNFYGAYLVLMTIFRPSGTQTDTGSRVALSRTTVSVLAALFTTLFGIEAAASVLTFITNFLTLTLAILIPWTAINLTDFYLVRRGHYAIQEFFRRDGVYGLLNISTIIIYAVTVGIEMIFVNATFYEGPVASSLNGADISWLVGFLLAATLYLVWSRRTKVDAVPISGQAVGGDATPMVQVE